MMDILVGSSFMTILIEAHDSDDRFALNESLFRRKRFINTFSTKLDLPFLCRNNHANPYFHYSASWFNQKRWFRAITIPDGSKVAWWEIGNKSYP
jgi:hypothetical protein